MLENTILVSNFAVTNKYLINQFSWKKCKAIHEYTK